MFFSYVRNNDYAYGGHHDGGAAFIVLDPRNLNGHSTIPAPPASGPQNPSPGLSRSKWSVNSTNSMEERRPSIDLEWENDGNLL
jgi:hypothetical protein